MMKILVVEDHPVVRTALCKLLSAQAGVSAVASAADGHAAMLMLAEGFTADILLTDLHMPGIDGLELTRQAIRYNRSIRVVILTMQETHTVREAAAAAGAKRCLSKNGEFDELMDALRQVHAA